MRSQFTDTRRVMLALGCLAALALMLPTVGSARSHRHHGHHPVQFKTGYWKAKTSDGHYFYFEIIPHSSAPKYHCDGKRRLAPRSRYCFIDETQDGVLQPQNVSTSRGGVTPIGIPSGYLSRGRDTFDFRQHQSGTDTYAGSVFNFTPGEHFFAQATGRGTTAKGTIHQTSTGALAQGGNAPYHYEVSWTARRTSGHVIVP